MRQIVILIFLYSYAYAQEFPESLTIYLENEDVGQTELSYLHEVLERPLNLNDCYIDDLLQLPFISKIEANAILRYRKSKGYFRSVYELQAIDGLKRNTISLLLECVRVEPKSVDIKKIRHQWTALYQSFLEEQKEFSDSTYIGGKSKNYLRYKGKTRNMNFGLLTEKDAGEKPLDFYSFHFDLKKRNTHIFIGDYQLSLGQGLLHYQGFGFGKSADVLNTFKRTKTLRSHTSTRENQFYRGFAIEQKHKNWKLSSWLSYKPIDGNEDEESRIVTSISETGLHRTDSEIENKNQLLQKTYGARVNFEKKRFNSSIYFKNQIWDKPIKALNDTIEHAFYLASDYSITLKNMHLFGEISLTQNVASYLSALTINLSKNLSYALLYRNYSPDYFALESNAFGEQTTNRNERGLYSAVNVDFSKKWSLSFYSDYYYFPEESYYSNSPLRGKDFRAQLTHKPSKQWQALARFNYEAKTNNLNDELGLHSIQASKSMNILAQINYRRNDFSFKSRSVWSNKDDNWGYLIFYDVKYNPLESPWACSLRYLLFDTPDYSTRVYVYEPDVLYSFSVPAFYGEGKRVVGLLKYRFNKHLTFNFKLAQTVYFDETPIRSGSVKGDRLTDFKVLIKYVL